MFCPRCECEYRPGFRRCADCGVALVAALPAAVGDAAPAEDTWMTYEIPDPALLATVISLLQSSDIPFHILDQFSSKHVPKIAVPEAFVGDLEALFADLARAATDDD